MIQIYTDGSAHPNPGPGGYGIFGFDAMTGEIVTVGARQYQYTTNNAMELTAIVKAFETFGSPTYQKYNVTIYTDSAYAYNTFTKWIFDWEKRGWKKADKKEPENLDIIQQYWGYYKIGWRVNFELIPGHSGNKWNDLVDKLATGKKTLQEVQDEFRDDTYFTGRVRI